MDIQGQEEKMNIKQQPVKQQLQSQKRSDSAYDSFTESVSDLKSVLPEHQTRSSEYEEEVFSEISTPINKTRDPRTRILPFY